jgi:hypothetical protein
MTENVLEKLGATESTTLALKREDGGKIRVTSLLWPEPKVILKGEVLDAHRSQPPIPRRMGPAGPGLWPLLAGR